MASQNDKGKVILGQIYKPAVRLSNKKYIRIECIVLGNIVSFLTPWRLRSCMKEPHSLKKGDGVK
jgi:hypothetical protein